MIKNSTRTLLSQLSRKSTKVVAPLLLNNSRSFSTSLSQTLTPTYPPTNNSHKLFNTEKAGKAIGPYSHCTVFNERLIFVSGQLGIDPTSGTLVEGLEGQCHQALKNMQAILEGAGSGMDCVLKTTILLTDMAHFEVVNKIYESYFSKNKPARATFAVKALPKGGVVEIEAIAYQRVTPQHQ